MQQERLFHVVAEWDPEAAVWYVSESDVPGLAAEAATIEEMVRELAILVPEMLELNAHLLDEPVHGPVPLSIVAKKQLELVAC